MNIVPIAAGHAPAVSDWCNPHEYTWIEQSSRRALAWEFLRRDVNYKSDYATALGCADLTDKLDMRPSENWPLLRLVDHMLDARNARPLWKPDVCDDVLSLHAGLPLTDHVVDHLHVSTATCDVVTVKCPIRGRSHILFAQADRFLQVQITGQEGLDAAELLMPVLAPRHLCEKRNLALKRLNDIVDCGALRPQLFPSDKRALRLARILQTLDGVLAGARHKEIATALYGPDRVARDWNTPGKHLRDHVRRAVAQGRQMMLGGYRKLLK